MLPLLGLVTFLCVFHQVHSLLQCDPVDFESSTGKRCFSILVDKKLDFNSAEAACVAHKPGGHLATVANAFDNIIVTIEIAEGVIGDGVTVDMLWLGLRRANESSPWAWNDGDSSTFRYWGDWGSDSPSKDGNCAVALDEENAINGEPAWASVNCSAQAYPLCQYPPNSF